MKTTYQILEEVAKERGASSTADLRDMVTNRIVNDKTLDRLVNNMALGIVISQGITLEALRVVFASGIMMWEEVNNRYNEQFRYSKAEDIGDSPGEGVLGKEG
jgi:hypothetical protein